MSDPTAELSRAEADWAPLDAEKPGSGRSFVSGEPHGDRLRVRYFQRQQDGALVGKAWFGPGCEGPPGFAHGGAVAALIDEASGGAAWLAGHPVVAARLTVDFRQRLPLETVVTFEAHVVSVEGRKVTARGQVRGVDGTIYASGENLLIELDPSEFGAEAMDIARGIWRPGTE